MHFKFRVLIDTEEYECMHNMLLVNRMLLKSCGLFKFWEISDKANISETVQDRDIVAMKD